VKSLIRNYKFWNFRCSGWIRGSATNDAAAKLPIRKLCLVLGPHARLNEFCNHALNFLPLCFRLELVSLLAKRCMLCDALFAHILQRKQRAHTIKQSMLSFMLCAHNYNS